ncbi:hypothetical protein ACFQ80_05940 [Isoptericola sp. NPDC056578]|uniref:hypothetical protein n=1 Tax=Isoptericola sp. NPDC056578 TaxID=3345870 RepID=UPI00368DC4B0
MNHHTDRKARDMAKRSSSHGPARPDGYVVDADRGSGPTSTKSAALLDTDEHAQRTVAREGLRDLDRMTEAMPGLNRLQKDRDRLMPRETNAELRHPVMQRRLPPAGQVRAPASSRQRKARSKARTLTLAGLPEVQVRTQHALVSREAAWRSVNDQLSEHTGDVAELSDADQARVRRIDRSIQAYERHNDRGHVLYANVAMPWYINRQNVAGFVANNFRPGRRLSFDRYTAATHQLHETAGQVVDERGRVVVFEMETRRGAYLGRSDGADNTQHLLPRGLEFEVVGSHEATFRRPDGSTGKKRVVQLRDVTDEK